ncbi:hypothetical protein KC19_VG159300 [Ceratodon purpureus]|uniref:Uncharacterized protein n=1 Tax=Ceratodon purpureus TaxID=3225 RepID=A0A8T0HR03_CERPU|nr:hypothetical protein KC19_VG159300 [Ceratodon purpureus]
MCNVDPKSFEATSLQALHNEHTLAVVNTYTIQGKLGTVQGLLQLPDLCMQRLRLNQSLDSNPTQLGLCSNGC